MSDNMLNQTFGLNIKLPKRTIKQSGDTINTAITGVWQPLFEYMDEHKNVFNGNIAEEIEKYTLMQYNTGAILRDSAPEITFDIKG